MNKTIGIQLIVYSLVLAGLGYLTHYLAPAMARSTFITGLVGGALCLVWGLRARAGTQGKALPILTLIPVCFILLSQTVMGWGSGSLPGHRPAAAVTTLLFVLSIGMLMRIAYSGVIFDKQPAITTNDGGAKLQTAEKPAAQANAVNRA